MLISIQLKVHSPATSQTPISSTLRGTTEGLYALLNTQRNTSRVLCMHYSAPLHFALYSEEYGLVVAWFQARAGVVCSMWSCDFVEDGL